MKMPLTFRIFVGIMVVLGLVFIAYILSYQTNLFYAQAGGIIEKKISLDEEELGGVITLSRDDRSKSTKDWVSFSKDKHVDFTYFSKDSNYNQYKKLYIQVPNSAKPGEYYFGINIRYHSGEQVKETISFRVVERFI